MEPAGGVLSWILLMSSVLLNVYANLILKFDISRIGGMDLSSISSTAASFMKLLSSPLGLSGVLCMFGGAAFWMATLSRMDVSTAFPISMTLNLLLIAAGGVVFFNEYITLNKIVGVALILASIYFLSK